MQKHFGAVTVLLISGLASLSGGCAVNQEFARWHATQGERAVSQHRLDAALAEFREAVRLDPQFAEGHYQLGMIYKEKGELEQAASSMQEAVRLDPTKPKPIFELAEIYRLLEKLTQAVRAYAMACELDPRNFDLRFRLATCYHENGELDQAIESYRTAIKLDPHNAFARSNLGAALAAQGKDYDAIKAYKESLECQEAQPIVLVNLATVYLNQERWEAAHRTLQVALGMDPNLSPGHERMGYCLWREQAYDKAAESYRKAIELDGHNAAAHAGLGVVLMTLYLDHPDDANKRDTAVEEWHRSLELKPDQPKLKALVEKYRTRYEKPPVTIEN